MRANGIVSEFRASMIGSLVGAFVGFFGFLFDDDEEGGEGEFVGNEEEEEVSDDGESLEVVSLGGREAKAVWGRVDKAVWAALRISPVPKDKSQEMHQTESGFDEAKELEAKVRTVLRDHGCLQCVSFGRIVCCRTEDKLVRCDILGKCKSDLEGWRER